MFVFFYFFFCRIYAGKLKKISFIITIDSLRERNNLSIIFQVGGGGVISYCRSFKRDTQFLNLCDNLSRTIFMNIGITVFRYSGTHVRYLIITLIIQKR